MKEIVTYLLATFIWFSLIYCAHQYDMYLCRKDVKEQIEMVKRSTEDLVKISIRIDSIYKQQNL